ncbi:HigA family addiction module antitoxin [Leptothoe sp. EHU-05/26/07-4]
MNMSKPLHPGEFITHVYLQPLGIRYTKLAGKLNVDPSTVKKLLNKEIVVTPEMALRLSAVLGSSAYFWLSMQSHYSLWEAEQTLDVSTLGQAFSSSHSLSTPIRVQILELLEESEMALEDICEQLKMPQDQLSLHLQSLETAALVTTHQQYGQTFYGLNIARVNTLTQETSEYPMARRVSAP